MKYVKSERLWLSDHPELSEGWVKDRIAEDPTLLGLGDLVVRDRERLQQRTHGYLDMLLEDPDADVLYEVEVQLGTMDADHIVRAMQYWNRERLRTPQARHRAVLVVEEAGRFFDVPRLFRDPPIVIEMAAYRVGDDGVQLTFHTVSEAVADDEVIGEPEPPEAVDRAYWTDRSSEQSLAITDRVIALAQRNNPKIEAKYNRHYIGLMREGAVDNYAIFYPRKGPVAQCLLRLPESEIASLVAQGLHANRPPDAPDRVRLRLQAADVVTHEALLTDLLRRARGEES